MKVKVPKKEEIQVPIQRITPDGLLERLKPFEQQYGLSSPEFFEKFKAGTIEETRETVDWFILYETYLRVMERQKHAPET
jgi:hypothetical protein